MPVAIRSSGGGATTLVATSSASDYTATLPANSGTVVTTGSTAVVTQAMLSTNVSGNGPAFSAYIAGTQTIAAATWVKLSFDTKIFDTNTNFNTSTNRFTPTVAGYYQINGTIQPLGSNINAYIAAYKNGTINQYGTFSGASTASNPIISISTLIYCNGSTDYIELYVNSGGTSVSGGSAGNISNFSGFLARSA